MMEIAESSAVLRVMTCEQRILEQPDGSATFSQGRTAVMAAVYGPVEVRAAKERADRATLDVVFKPKVGMPSCSARAVENAIRGACEAAVLLVSHPRSLFTIVVQELHDDGALLACSVNAVCAALLDACAPMRFPFVAVSCCVDADGQIAVDPDASHDATAMLMATFVFDGREKRNVLGVVSTGHVSDAQFQTCLAMCRQASGKVLDCFRNIYAKRASTM